MTPPGGEVSLSPGAPDFSSAHRWETTRVSERIEIIPRKALLWMVTKSVRTTLKPRGTIVCLVVTRESSIQGFLGGARFRPSTVGKPFQVIGGCCVAWEMISEGRSNETGESIDKNAKQVWVGAGLLQVVIQPVLD